MNVFNREIEGRRTDSAPVNGHRGPAYAPRRRARIMRGRSRERDPN